MLFQEGLSNTLGSPSQYSKKPFSGSNEFSKIAPVNLLILLQAEFEGKKYLQEKNYQLNLKF